MTEKPEEKKEHKLPVNPDNTNDPTDQEFFDDFGDMDIADLVPSMNVNKDILKEPEEAMIDDDDLWGIYGEIMDNCRNDRKSVDEVLVNFIDMVMNEGDASSASKEAIVNLLKIKSDSSDKMSKIADLMTRIKLKNQDTFPRYLAAQQNNKVVIEGSKREMIKSINKLTAKKKISAPPRTNNE